MADGTDLYSFGFSDVTGVPSEEIMTTASLAANFPAPTIALKEGQKFYLKLSNVGMMLRPDLFDSHSVHFHGFPNAAPVFDGVPDSSITIQMGGTLTYFYNLATAGTFIYHCHVEATEHMQMGMLGQLYVQPKQNNLPNGTNLRGFTHQTGFNYVYNDGDGSTRYDVEYPIQIAGFDRTFHELHLGIQPLPFALMKDTYPMINGRGYPDTISTNAITNMNGHASQKVSGLITATRGQKILLRISSLATVDFHTLTAQGIPMKVVGKGASLLRGPNNGATPGKNLYYDTSSVTLGGGETADVILDTARVGTGTYFLYATRLHALSNDQEDNGGMMTEIVIR
jgi:FtsP/CotA-like multicopper oxidase with cupredoxin domain